MPCRAGRQCSRRCSGCSDSRACSGRATRSMRWRCGSCRSARTRGLRGTSTARTRCVTSCSSAAGRCATPPRARSWFPPGPADPVIVYGRNPVLEALRGRRRVSRVWAGDGRLAGLVAARAPGVPLESAGPDELERMSGSAAHQGLVCAADPYPYADPETLLDDEQAMVVALDQIQDPQNLGAVSRSAEGAGAAGLVIPERRAAEVT